MEPLSIQSQSALVLRPGANAATDLARVLERGRVVAGEVLERLGGGSILIGVGGHRVPAQSELALVPGDRFLLRVEEQEGKFLLRILERAQTSVDPPLIRALRGLL